MRGVQVIPAHAHDLIVVGVTIEWIGMNLRGELSTQICSGSPETMQASRTGLRVAMLDMELATSSDPVLTAPPTTARQAAWPGSGFCQRVGSVQMVDGRAAMVRSNQGCSLIN